MFKNKVQELCLQNNWDFNLFEKYVSLIEEKNKVMNLTGFSGDRLWQEGIYESLIFMNAITEHTCNGVILDIGAGAGFPSIPYVLTKPNNKIVIYEPLKKRVDFLNLVIQELNLDNWVSIQIKRIEEEEQKNIFDIVTARAVSDVRSLIMAAFHTVKLDGKMSLIKGKNLAKEVEQAQDILKMLKYEMNIFDLKMDGVDKENKVIEITKKRSTPKQFPFKWKDIVKNKNNKG
ncbi:16S rRNA methyltransferase [Mycoplasmopsis gallinacea]|uniref:Ribosomal RNA small subunit methyltransferase G n=1 Tax=Mycoplasmopsis gallinacea TaxID=29556 RepID=A0A0D5ZKK9_9BACT|nr:16S rRNA methyltransferase [Mycoplasmopsis gallinacea]